VLGSQKKHDHTNNHPDAGRHKSILPTEHDLERRAKKVADERAYVDSHVEDIVAFVLFVLVLLVVVEIPEQRRNVGFEKSVADNY
jgi:hypothetical protein